MFFFFQKLSTPISKGYDHMIQLYIDASTEVTTGISGVGIVVKYQQKTTQYAIPLINHYTNHEAEFIALIISLTIAKNYHDPHLYIFSDSQTIVDALSHHSIHHPNLKELLYIAKQRCSSFETCEISWLSEKNNKGADHLARQACQQAKRNHHQHQEWNPDCF